MPTPGTFTFKLDDDLDAGLRAMASLTGKSASDIVREAVMAAVSQFVESGKMDRVMSESAETLRSAARVLQERRAGQDELGRQESNL